MSNDAEKLWHFVVDAIVDHMNGDIGNKEFEDRTKEFSDMLQEMIDG